MASSPTVYRWQPDSHKSEIIALPIIFGIQRHHSRHGQMFHENVYGNGPGLPVQLRPWLGML